MNKPTTRTKTIKTILKHTQLKWQTFQLIILKKEVAEGAVTAEKDARYTSETVVSQV